MTPEAIAQNIDTAMDITDAVVQNAESNLHAG
jgi:hypothetical protein